MNKGRVDLLCLLSAQRAFWVVGALCALLSCPQEGKAANPRDYLYGITQEGVWNSNPLMLRQNAQEMYGSETKIFFGFQKEAPTTKVRTQASIVNNETNRSLYDTTDLSFKASLEKAFLRSSLSLEGSYDYDTTRTSEVTTFGQDIGKGRRNSFFLQPSFLYRVSERGFLGLSGRWLETRYAEETLVDYSIRAITPSFGYHLTPRHSVVLSVQSQRYALLEETDRYIDSVGPSLLWKYKISPTLALDVSGGYLASKTHGYTGVENKWEHNVIYGATVSHTTPQNLAVLSATRARQPYSNGTETYLTSFEVRNQHKINEVLDFNLKANYQFSKQSLHSASSLERALSGDAGISYKLGQNWTTSLSYRYRTEELKGTNDPTEQQVIRLGLTYQFGRP